MPNAAKPAKSAAEEEEEERAEIERNRLPDDAVVDVEEERKKSNSDEVLDRLDRELVGLVPVKTRIKEIADLLVVDRLRQQRARLRQATRIVGEKNHKLSKSDLMRIEAEDILKGRVFEDEGDGPDANED